MTATQKVEKLLGIENPDDVKALWEYHCQIAGSLENDIRTNEPVYNPRLTKSLIKLHGGVPWKEAYQKALDYHNSLHLIDGGDTDWYESRSNMVELWIDDVIVLGRPPKISYTKWLKKRAKKKR